jgi:hypothetical protein
MPILFSLVNILQANPAISFRWQTTNAFSHCMFSGEGVVWTIIGILVRGLGRAMLKEIQCDIDTMNDSISEAEHKQSRLYNRVIRQGRKLRWTRSEDKARNPPSTVDKLGASAQLISSKFSFCSACFTDIPRYMRRRVTMTACGKKHVKFCSQLERKCPRTESRPAAIFSLWRRRMDSGAVVEDASDWFSDFSQSSRRTAG